MGDPGQAAGRARDDHHRVPTSRTGGERCAEIAQAVTLERIGRNFPDFVRPDLPARMGEHQPDLEAGNERHQRIEQPPGVDGTRGSPHGNDQLHDATTIVATPEGNSPFVSTEVNPTSFMIAANSAVERKAAIESGR